MKNIITIFLLLFSCSLYSQSDSVKLPKNVEESLIVLDELLPDSSKSYFKLMNEDEILPSLHLTLGMWIRNNWGLWHYSELWQSLNDIGLVHPEEMSSVILISYHRKLNNKPIKLNEQIEFYNQYRKGETQKQIEQKNEEDQLKQNNLNWLNQNKVKFREIVLGDREVIYDCDSFMMLRQKKGDTLILWLPAIIGFVDTNQLGEWLIKDQLGIDKYIEGIYMDGRIEYRQLQPTSFIIRNDSLFEFTKIYTISNDSIQSIYKAAFALEDLDASMNYLEINLEPNRIPRFKLIFHPQLFGNSKQYVGNIQNDVVKLESKWLIDSIIYYSVRIENHIGENKTSYAYIIDENFKFIKYEGCNSGILKRLNEDHEID